MGDTEFGQQRLCRRDLVGLAVDRDMSEHEGGIGGKCAQHLHGGLVMEIVEAAAQRLAIEGDAARPRRGTSRLQQGGVTAEGRLYRSRIEPLEDVADRRVGGRPAPPQPERGIEPVAMDVDEGDDATIRVAAAHDGQDGEQEHIRQRIELPLRSARIGDVCQQVQ